MYLQYPKQDLFSTRLPNASICIVCFYYFCHTTVSTRNLIGLFAEIEIPIPVPQTTIPFHTRHF